MERLMAVMRQQGAREEQMWADEPMHRHTTMRVGGPADLLFEPSDEAQLLMAMRAAREHGAPVVVLGGGSNVIVRDGGVRGLVIKLSDRFSGVTCEGSLVAAAAGARLSKVAAVAQRAGLAGLEFAAGIPGTVGGGVLMNAGAYGGEIAHVLRDGRVLIEDTVHTLSRADFAFGYRRSSVMDNGGVVLGATFELSQGEPGAIEARMQELAERRRDKQPLAYPSAGSTFKRPEGHFAGALIESAGLKGLRVGGAEVSSKHAGFVVNTGGATARDVLNLIEEVRLRVLRHGGVELECEVRVIGEE